MFRLNEYFWTVQGEGVNSGRRAAFIRLPFCNYNCHWCDTSYNTYEEIEKHDLSEFLDQEKSRFVVVTGGEPLMNKQTPELIEFLKARGFEIAVETNGSMPALDGIDFVTCSPKKYVQKGLPEYFINPALYREVDEFKYVVDDQFDMSVLERHNLDLPHVVLSLSPEFNQFSQNLTKMLEYIKENPRWKISLQTHKWMGLR